MIDVPLNHWTNFDSDWWNERRLRDYFVDDEGCMHLRLDSPTSEKLRDVLTVEAIRIASGATRK